MQQTFYVIRFPETDQYIQPSYHYARSKIHERGNAFAMCDLALTNNWVSAIKFASKKAALDSLQFSDDEYEQSFTDIYGELVQLRQGEAEIVKITVNIELV